MPSGYQVKASGTVNLPSQDFSIDAYTIFTILWPDGNIKLNGKQTTASFFEKRGEIRQNIVLERLLKLHHSDRYVGHEYNPDSYEREVVNQYYLWRKERWHFDHFLF